MKIDGSIGTSGAVLSHAARVAVTARWGAYEVPSVEPSMRQTRLRVEAGTPSIVTSPGHPCGPNRPEAMNAPFAFDLLAVQSAGVPSPRSERCP